MSTTPTIEAPRLYRPQHAPVAGVCAGLATHLGLPVKHVRIGMAVAALFGGLGLVAYALLWGMTPQEHDSQSGHDRRESRFDGSTWLLVVGAALLLGGVISISGALGGAWGMSLETVIPVLAVGGGAVLAWSQLDRGAGRREGIVRVAIGAILALGGVVALIVREQGVGILWDVAIATLAVLGGLALVLGPWVMRFWQRFQAEQTTRIRETERADIAAHLHDSVLQTLALIQRTDDPARITRLARAQERELRAWLYGAPKSSTDSLAESVTQAAHEIEDLHGVPIDVVVTGDRPLEESGAALVAAVREALANAVRHGAPPVSVYVEIGPSLVEVFVRDHGPGFDIDAVPEDRLGVRESLFGRMERHGGTARIRRLDEGTEVSLTLPVDPVEPPDADRDAADPTVEAETPSAKESAS